MKHLLKNFLIFLIIFLIISGIFSLINIENKKTEEITLDKMVQEIQEEKIKEITIEGTRLNIVLIDESQQYAYKEENESFASLIKNFNIPEEKITKITLKVKDTANKNIFWTVILPFVLPLIFLIGFIWFFTRQVQGAGVQAFKFGESQARKISPKDKKIKVTFKDVAGVKEAKEALEEVIEFLKNPKKFSAVGAKIPKGVLLVGPPGSGKTLLARAVAGEASVPFFHLSGSEFVEMFVGVGAARVRDLFQKAKKNLPCIVFIDELDAVGRHRGAGIGGGHDEREQTLNQILVELDGFESNSGLVVMSATNRPDILDPALLRPGRFDRKIILDLPDLKDREEILKIHIRNKPLAGNVNLKRIAERTPGFSGADLENLLNEAALLAAKRNKLKINNTEIIESVERVLLGPERKSHILSEKERKIVAYHEAGHAVIGYSLPGCDPIQKVSIIARGLAAGYTLQMPTEDKYLRNKSEFMDQLTSLLGGYASEEKVFSQVTTGAADDLHKATQLARRLVTEFGMSAELGPRTFGEKEKLIFLGREIAEHRDYSEKTAQTIDEEVSKIINLCYNKAKSILEANRTKLDKISDLLLKKETLEKEEFEKAMEETA